MIFIKLILGVAALYSFGMYCYGMYLLYVRGVNTYDQEQLAEWSFRLALCGILAIGFLGLLSQPGHTIYVSETPASAKLTKLDRGFRYVGGSEGKPHGIINDTPYTLPIAK